MIILDTDHLSVLKYARDARFTKLAQRMADSPDQDFVNTAITLEQQLRGWLAEFNRYSDPEKQLPAYTELTGLIDFFSFWTVVPFDAAAASMFRNFRLQKNRAGSMDLKIASIAVSLDCVQQQYAPGERLCQPFRPNANGEPNRISVLAGGRGGSAKLLLSRIPVASQE